MAVRSTQPQIALFYYDSLLKSVARVAFIVIYGSYLNYVLQYPIHWVRKLRINNEFFVDFGLGRLRLCASNVNRSAPQL